MKQQTKNGLWAVALGTIIGTMAALAGNDTNAEQEQSITQYCEGVAVYAAEEARGVPLENRTGHRDWDESINVEEQCPGMRPAGPALNSQEFLTSWSSRYAMPDTAPANQLVQF
ncbi:hypothetical protein SAMN04487958_107162 [Vreelandella subterranea]|uniref:Uncharacterized protein n=1 Tax=Vreelandella subterranea TaxID=416874 RepID=A0A1H9UQM4_9GAMM|nr:hypothetical protein [Halomonas subterranea]SES11785.1 hypothetical protein SAMN04487958_107162 [Halomonas subterranea]